jgi:pimeloyl-ACP methyl ester carboxylesterase
MYRRGLPLIILACAFWLGGLAAVDCQPADPARRFPLAKDYQPAADVGFRIVSILSDGVRLHGEMFWPRSEEGQRLPTVVMANGWGGVAAALRRDANGLAEAGYLVILFDYRGWGESDSRVVLTGSQPAGGGRFMAEVQPLRGYIDPFEQVEDWFNAIDWAAGEPMADMNRLGLRLRLARLYCYRQLSPVPVSQFVP